MDPHATRRASERSSAAASEQQVPDEDNDDRADHGHNDRLDVDAGRILEVEERSRKVAPDDGPDDAEEDSGDDSFIATHDHVCDEAGDRP